MPDAARPGWLEAMVVVLIGGYLLMTRSFAHLGVAPLFVGEAALVAFLLARGPTVFAVGWTATTGRSPLAPLAWCYFLFLAYGTLQTFRGLPGDYPKTALQNYLFHLYPLYLVAGLLVAGRFPGALARLVRPLAWVHGLYGVLYAVLLHRLFVVDENDWHEVPFFGQPAGAAVVIVALVCFEPALRRVWLPLLLNGFVLLAVQVRAEWLSLLVALALWAVLAGRVAQMARLAALLGGLLLVGFVTDFRMPSPGKRGGEFSARDVVGRALSAVNEDWAAEFSHTAEDTASTVSWRTSWWDAIWKRVHRDAASALFGPGYGYPIWKHHPEDLGGFPLRTPHNIFVFCLGYSGWIGVAIYALFQAALGATLWRVYRLSGQPLGICLWAMFFVWAFFDNLMEAPYGAIPFYLLAGLALAPLAADVLGRAAAPASFSQSLSGSQARLA